MTEEILQELRGLGIKPELMDWVPFYRNPVPCGIPTYIGDEESEMIEIPASLVNQCTTFVVEARGDSMTGCGIYDGDKLTVHMQPIANDGEVVVATIGGQVTVKVFFEDEDKNAWLLPQNEDYAPICLKDSVNARIVGKVVSVTHKEPKISYRECVKLVKKARKELLLTPSQQKINNAIIEIKPMIQTARQWFAVYRVLIDRKVIEKDDFHSFRMMVECALGNDAPTINEADMRRIEVLSFSKPVILWDEQNAPVQGKRFSDYLNIAKSFSSLLT